MSSPFTPIMLANPTTRARIRQSNVILYLDRHLPHLPIDEIVRLHWYKPQTLQYRGDKSSIFIEVFRPQPQPHNALIPRAGYPVKFPSLGVRFVQQMTSMVHLDAFIELDFTSCTQHMDGNVILQPRMQTSFGRNLARLGCGTFRE